MGEPCAREARERISSVLSYTPPASLDPTILPNCRRTSTSTRYEIRRITNLPYLHVVTLINSPGLASKSFAFPGHGNRGPAHPNFLEIQRCDDSKSKAKSTALKIVLPYPAASRRSQKRKFTKHPIIPPPPRLPTPCIYIAAVTRVNIGAQPPPSHTFPWPARTKGKSKNACCSTLCICLCLLSMNVKEVEVKWWDGKGQRCDLRR